MNAQLASLLSSQPTMSLYGSPYAAISNPLLGQQAYFAEPAMGLGNPFGVQGPMPAFALAPPSPMMGMPGGSGSSEVDAIIAGANQIAIEGNQLANMLPALSQQLYGGGGGGLGAMPSSGAIPTIPMGFEQNMLSQYQQLSSQLYGGGLSSPVLSAPPPPQKGGGKRTTVTPLKPAFGNTGDVLAKAAKSMEGMSSKAGPDGGNLACAWMVAKVLREKGIDVPVGTAAEVSVDGQVKFLKEKGAKLVSRSQAKPGDIVYNSRHIGVVTEGEGKSAKVLSNSSSRRAFAWKSDTNFDGYYGEESKVLRLA